MSRIILVLFTAAAVLLFFSMKQTPERMYAEFVKNLKQNDINASSKVVSQMYQKFGGHHYTCRAASDLVRNELEPLINKSEFLEAENLIEKKLMEFPWLDFLPARKKIQLAKAACAVKEKNYAACSVILADLLILDRNDLMIHREIVRIAGIPSLKPPLKEASDSACFIAEHCDDRLTTGEAATLYFLLSGLLPDLPRAMKLRELLIRKSPDACEMAINDLLSPECEKRLAAAAVIRDCNKMDSISETRVQFLNLLTLTPLYRKYLADAVIYFRQFKPGEEWDMIRDSIGIGKGALIFSLETVDELSNEVCSIIASLFFSKLSETVLEMCSSQSPVRRLNGWKIIDRSGNSIMINCLEFHKKNISITKITDFLPECELFSESLSYFENHPEQIKEVSESVRKSLSVISEQKKNTPPSSAYVWGLLERMEKEAEQFLKR